MVRMQFLGLHQEGLILKIAQLQKEKNQASIKLLHSFVTKDNAEDVKPLYMLESQKQKNNFILTSCLPADEVLFRKTLVRLSKLTSIKKVLPFQFEESHPYPFSDAVALSFISKKKDGTDLSFFSTKKQLLSNHLQTIASLSIDPDFVTCEPQALYRFTRHFFPKEENLFVFHLGKEKSCWISIVEGNLEITQSLDTGSLSLFSALEEDFPKSTNEELLSLLREKKNLDFLQSSSYPKTKEAFSHLQKALLRVYLFCKQKQTILPTKIVCTGDFSFIPCMELFYKESLPSLSPVSLEAQKESFSSFEIHSFAMAIGAGLDALSQDKKTLQFRKEEFTSSKETKRKKKYLVQFALSFVFFCFSFYFAKEMFFEKKVSSLVQNYIHLFPSSFEKVSYDVVNMSLEQIEKREKTLLSSKNHLSLLPKHAPISEILLFLSTHKALQSQGEESIRINSFHYFLPNYPKLGKKIEPFVGKVEIEFTTSSPQLAKAFHDLLLSNKELVDTRKKVSWNQTGEVYTTSFFLASKGVKK